MVLPKILVLGVIRFPLCVCLQDLASDDDEAFERTVRDIFQATVELL